MDIDRSSAEVSDLESTVQVPGTPETCSRASQLGSVEKVNLRMVL